MEKFKLIIVLLVILILAASSILIYIIIERNKENGNIIEASQKINSIDKLIVT